MIRACLATAALAVVAVAQEPINTDAAIQPSTDQFVIREQLMIHRARRDRAAGQESVTEWMPVTMVNYGITFDLATSVRIPLRYRTGDRLSGVGLGPAPDEEWDLGDIGVRFKWRVLQNDPGPVQTERLTLIGGVELDTGDGVRSLDPDFAEGSTNPTLGFAYTRVMDRVGLGCSAEWEFQTDGDPDSGRADGAVLFRVAPDRFGPGDTGAWYALLEANSRFDAGGQAELMLSPGIMYEGQTWTYEASVQLPVAGDRDDWARSDAVFVLGARLLF